MDGGGSKQETVTEPWEGIRPYLRTGYQQARTRLLDQPGQYFPGQTYVPFAPETETALAGTTGRALTGSPLNPAAQGQIMGTLGGGYLPEFPGYRDIQGDIADAVMSEVRPGVDSAFARGGRFGSPLHAEALGRGVSRGMAQSLVPLALGQQQLYGAERGRMMGAAQMAPQLAREDYFDISQLGGVGAAREDLYGRALEDQISRFNFMQADPVQRLQTYMALISGGMPAGAGATVSRGGQQGPGTLGTLMGIAGLGLAGAGTLGGLGWRPF